MPDSAGFVVNRLLFPYLFDAVRLLERGGLDAEAVDTCMKLGAGHPLGPLALLDFVGLDVAAAIGESIGADVPERVRELVAAGKLGRKSGAGFYATRQSRPARRGGSARGAGVAIPAVRSQTTSASPMPCCSASSATRSHGSVASGRSSQRARSSASSAPSSAGLISPRPPLGLLLDQRAQRVTLESLSLTHHIAART